METEKLYYAAVVLISAVSILLSPFFYMKMAGGSRKVPRPKPTAKSWRIIAAGNLLAAAGLFAVWYFWLR
ncbi:MAG: hypothetical protein Q4D82_06670 [Neisseria sp.]|nr:hypothetical protein [Neisseria sp.]